MLGIPPPFSEIAAGFAIGAIAVTFLSVTTQKFGTRVGGSLAGFPASIAATLFFLGQATDPQTAAQAAEVIPMAEGLRGIFVICFLSFLRRGLGTALVASFVVWFALATLIAFLGPFNLITSVLVLVACIVLCDQIFRTRLIPLYSHTNASNRRDGETEVKLSSVEIVIRLLAGGSTVALAIYIGIALGPLAAGIVASFPTVVACTLVVLHRHAGTEVAKGFGKNWFFHALVNTGVFACVVYFLYPAVGMVWGTISGFLGVLVSARICWLYIHREHTQKSRIPYVALVDTNVIDTNSSSAGRATDISSQKD